MKKLLFFGLLAALSLTAGAENRKWDFRNWSSQTVANLKAGSDWSDIEKATSSEPTELSKEKCFWEVAASGTSDGVEVMANGEAIAELQGLLYTNTTARSLAIAVDYGDLSSTGDGFGPYNGASYLWLGSSKKNYFIIPSVKAGATIKMGVESHKLTDARGVSLYVGHGTSGTLLKSPDGETVSAPKEYTEQEWYVPTDLADAANDDGTYDIQIYNTNGCHIYYIEVIEEAQGLEGARIAFVFDSSYSGYSEDKDVVRSIISDNDSFSDATIEPLDVAGDLSATDKDALIANYDLVVISSTVKEDNAYVSVLKEAIAYVPVLNLNAALYKAWGYGEAVSTGTNKVLVPEAVRTHELFKSSDELVQYIGDDGILELFASGNSITGVSIPEGSYFANDVVLGAVGDAVALHIHNQQRNAYLFIPYPYGNSSYPDNNLVYDILVNAMTLLTYSKSDVPQALAPTFTESYKHLNTDVTISCGTKDAVIYYTLDGSTPTDGSTLYTGPINVADEGVTINAIAYADGYSASEVAQHAVNIFSTSAKPSISVERQEGKSVVTISTEEEGAAIYYNITGSNKVEESSVYSEPLEVKEYLTITAFTGEVTGKKPSETVSEAVSISGKEIRIDEVSHFDANTTDWAPSGASLPYYYTEGKKNGYNYYLTHEEAGKTQDGLSDSTIIVIDGPADNLTVWNSGKGWEFKSYGQGGLLEKNTVSTDIDDTNTTNRYRAETALDAGASSYNITFGNVQKSNGVDNDPYSCSIQSTEAFQGPFDIVTFVGNGSTTNLPRADIYVSTDTTNADNWVKIDTVTISRTQRYIKKTRLSYEGTDKVFVKLQADFSSVMVFDIIIMNHGDNSQTATGIEDITAGKEAEGEVVRSMIYSINGTQLDKAARGINVIKEIYANGAVKTRKVIVK